MALMVSRLRWLVSVVGVSAIQLPVAQNSTASKGKSPLTGIFVCTLLNSYLLLCLDCPVFCPLLTTHTTQTSTPSAGFEAANPATERPQTFALDRSATTMLSVLRPYLFFVLMVLAFVQHSQQTNIHAFGGIRALNPNRRAVVYPRLRPLGHWDRQGFDPRTVHPVVTCYTD